MTLERARPPRSSRSPPDPPLGGKAGKNPANGRVAVKRGGLPRSVSSAMMVVAVRAIAGGVLAAETEIGSVRVTDRPLADMPVKLGHRPDPPRSLELKHDRLSLGACAWRRSQAPWWRGGSSDSTGGPDAGWRVPAGSPAGKTQAMDLADDGVAGDTAKLFGDLRGAQSLKPQGLQTLDARVGPAGVGHWDDPCCRAPIERTQHGPAFPLLTARARRPGLGIGYISPSALKLATSARPTTTWSWTAMPRARPPSTIRFVISMSAAEGV